MHDMQRVKYAVSPSQWPSGLRRGSAADRLLGLWVRIPPRAWMFVFCLLYNRDKGQKPGQSGHRSAIKLQKKKQKNIRRWRGCLSVVSVVCCQVEVSATGRSLVQRSPTDCGVSLCVIK
jgi:hypothetical protein